MGEWVIVIPVKRAEHAKSRLRVDEMDRTALARAMALDTMEAAAGCAEVARVVVVTDDEVVASSVPEGVVVVGEHGAHGLNAAIAAAMHDVGDASPRAALLGDLPALRPDDLAEALRSAISWHRAAVADGEGTGTTLVTAGVGVAWTSSFGSGSFARHLALGCEPLGIGASSPLRRDVDTAADLARATALGLGRRTMHTLAAGRVALGQ